MATSSFGKEGFEEELQRHDFWNSFSDFRHLLARLTERHCGRGNKISRYSTCDALKVLRGRVYVNSEEMGAIDRAAIEEFGVDVLSLMENAGAASASVARTMLGGDVAGRMISVLVGKGNNGGDGLAAARHLHNWGASVEVLLIDRSAMGAVPSLQLRSLEKTAVGIQGPDGSLEGSELLVDALLGYNLKGDPRGAIADLIERANVSGVPVLALDVPSGLDATSGEPGNPCVVARETVTMGFLKTGFLNPKARRFLGGVWLADVSFPRELCRRYLQTLSTFGRESIVKVD